MWLDELLNPVFLSLFESLDKVLLVYEVLFVLAKVLRADVLDFVKFLVVFFGKINALLLGLRSNAVYKRGELLGLRVKQ